MKIRRCISIRARFSRSRNQFSHNKCFYVTKHSPHISCHFKMCCYTSVHFCSPYYLALFSEWVQCRELSCYVLRFQVLTLENVTWLEYCGRCRSTGRAAFGINRNQKNTNLYGLMWNKILLFVKQWNIETYLQYIFLRGTNDEKNSINKYLKCISVWIKGGNCKDIFHFL